MFIRPLAAWLAKNWAGLAAGYAVTDIASGLSPGQRSGDKLAEPAEPESRIVRWMRDFFGGMVPTWVYGLITVFILYYIYQILDKFKK